MTLGINLTSGAGVSIATYTVTHRGNCVFINGDVPASAFSVLAKLAPEDSIMCEATARMYGVTFAMGLPDDIAALRKAAIPAEEKLIKEKYPALSHDAQQWLANGERGVSSNTIFTVITGVNALGSWEPNHPYDPDDFNRCLALLNAVPELRAKMYLMTGQSVEWARLIRYWGEIENLHLEEVGLNWTKANNAPKTYALMKRVINGHAP